MNKKDINTLTKLELIKLLHSPQVALFTPLGLGTGLGVGGGLIALSLGVTNPLLVASLSGSLITALLKVQHILELNRMETFLLQGLGTMPNPELERVPLDKIHWVYTQVANLPVSTQEVQEDRMARIPSVNATRGALPPKPLEPSERPTLSLPLKCTLILEGGGELITFPDWLTLEQLLFFVQRVCRERVTPNDENLCGTKYGAGGFTMSRETPGTLSLWREWLFQKGWAEANASGSWEKVRRKGWRITVAGRRKLQMCVSKLDPQAFKRFAPPPPSTPRDPLLHASARVKSRGSVTSIPEVALGGTLSFDE